MEDEDEQSQGTQSRVVRQRSNPEQPSELTSIRELLQEVSQEAHEGSVWFSPQHCHKCPCLKHLPVSEIDAEYPLANHLCILLVLQYYVL